MTGRPPPPRTMLDQRIAVAAVGHLVTENADLSCRNIELRYDLQDRKREWERVSCTSICGGTYMQVLGLMSKVSKDTRDVPVRCSKLRKPGPRGGGVGILCGKQG